MFQKEKIPTAIKMGAVTGITGALVSVLIGANTWGILTASLGSFAAAFIVFTVAGLTGKLVGFGLLGAAFGLVMGGWRGLLGGALGGVAYPLALRYIPGRLGSAVGLFVLIAIPGALIAGTWKGALAAALAALVFTLIFEGGLWLSRRLFPRK